MKNAIRTTLTASAAFVLVGCGTGALKSGAGLNETAADKQKAAEFYNDGFALVASNKASSDRCLASANEAKGKLWKALIRHANGCAKSGEWRKLETTAQELATAEIASPWGAYYLSLAAEHTNDLPRALWMADLALKKTPGAALFRYQRGRVLWKLKSFKEGVDEIATAAKLEPKLSDAHAFLGQTYHRDLNLDKAASHYEMALAADGRNRMCLEGLADIRLGQGKAEKAVELYTEAVSMAGDDVQLRVKLARAHEVVPANQELALANYRAARDLASKSRKVALDVDLNEKIKFLETKVMESKAGKQAKAEGVGPKSVVDRVPASESQRRTTK